QPTGQTISNVVTYNVLCAVDATDVQLLPSMTATVTIVTEQADDALLVPNAALSYAQAQVTRDPLNGVGTPVVVLRNGIPAPVLVQLGSSDGRTTQVLAGLQAGDQLVTASGTSTA